jgi:hypothetical protein
VESGTVRTVGSVGICAATVKSSMAVDCGGTAIAGSPISDCRGQSSGSADGVDADTALNCEGFSASRYGIYAWKTAIGCYGETSSDINPGLYARKASVCTGSGAAGGKAIAATLANGCSAEAGTSTVTYKYNMP